MRDQMTAKTSSTIAILAVLLVALCACGEKQDAKATPAVAPRTVTVVPVEMRVLEGGVVASGVLLSREEAAVSAEVSGYRVARVLADIGDVVRAGQPLVQLDDTLLRSQIDQQAALLAQSQVAAKQAAAQAARVAGLDGLGALSQEQIDERRFSAESAKAAAAAQAASLRDLTTRAGKMTVRAPVGGVVLQRQVRPGDLSGTGGDPMFRIARDNLVELEAQVPESALAGIRIGAPARVTLPDARRIQGVVRLIGPAVEQETKLGKVRIALPVTPGLRPGGYGSAEFTGGGGPTVAVPEAALRYDADGVSVMAVGADNRVKATPVRTGRRGGGYVELVAGPSAGTRVLLGAASFVLEGDVVRPVLATPAQASSGKAPPKAALTGKASAK